MSAIAGSTDKGRLEFDRYMKGEQLKPTEAIKAYCYDCMGNYDDYVKGDMDCKCPKCPLYPFMPYSSAYTLKYRKNVRIVPSDRTKAMLEHNKRICKTT